MPSMIWFIAAFDSSSAPGVSSIAFGLDHNLPQYYHNRWGFCGPAGTVEQPDPGWPEDPSTAGNRVIFGEPVVGDQFFPFYRVDVWGFEGAYYGTGIHPWLGYASFIDDGDRGEVDQVSRFGQVRWYQPGFNVCPGSAQEDLIACCFEGGECWTMFERDCFDIGGESLGLGSSCDPNPCPQLQRGVCCLETGACRLKTSVVCEEIGGTFHSEEVGCDPNPCPQPLFGACCSQSGDCVIESEPACEYMDGLFLEGLAECTPNPCYGACCFYNGDCQMQALYWCDPMGGEFMGAGSDCDPNPCVTSGLPEKLIHESTWGTIKARYR